MWIEGNYRRNLMDMHIDDWNEEFLSKLDCDEYIDALVDAGVQAAMVKAKSHTGLCYYPTEIGRMHRGLKGHDFFGEMVEKCHKNDIAVIAYYSQIFDNWAYDEHPDWRLVTVEGKQFRDYRGMDTFRNGRYGIVCPNNPDYREYVKANLQYLNKKYSFEGMFLDMTFWPEVCYCEHCRNRYLKETGNSMPEYVDWNDEEFLKFVEIREDWMTDFAKFSTSCVKEINPDVTIEHQFSMVTSGWTFGSTESLTEAVDYCGGDYYGGFLQETFINKYYKNVSPNLPFVYHTSRCDPELNMHTTTKTKEELMLHVFTALVHNGAFLLVDAINPDGTIVPEIYHGLMKSVYSKTSKYEQFVSGALDYNVAVWFATHSKFDSTEQKCRMKNKQLWPGKYQEGPIACVSVLRENNIPYDVIGSKNLKNLSSDVLMLSNVSKITDCEMDDIEAYVKRGGNLYISGPIGHCRLEKMLGIEIKELTDYDFLYMSPTESGKKYFNGFTTAAPLTTPMKQYKAKIIDEKNLEVIATKTYPYTMTNTSDFAAIHSNPPGVYTNELAAVIKTIGSSKLVWMSAPVEMTRPYKSRQVVRSIVESLIKEPEFTSNAPKFVEIIKWHKDNRTFIAAINEQEEPPIVAIHDIYVDVKGKFNAVTAADREPLKTECINGTTRIYFNKLELFEMIELIGD